MTGFAHVRKASVQGEVLITLKSVNHRGLDIHFHMSDEMDAFEDALRTVLKRHVSRGHVQARVVLTRTRPAAPALNRGLLDAYLAAFRQAARDLGLAGEPDLNAALALPGMFREDADEETDQAVGQWIVAAMEEAAEVLDAFREREGRELAADIAARTAAIHEAILRMEDLRMRATPALQARLAERLADLLNGAAIEPQRLAQEAALLADRSDIAEELTRLKVHAAALTDLLDRGGEVGKKMDFLLQEMGREANTVLSKSSGTGEIGLAITEQGLSVKAEIEKIREQALNLE